MVRENKASIHSNKDINSKNQSLKVSPFEIHLVKKGHTKDQFFYWTLSHEKVLIGENLRKIGMQGAIYYSLCLVEEETLSHLFLHCNLSISIQNYILSPLNSFSPPASIKDFLTNWTRHSQGNLREKLVLRSVCNSLHKYIYWKIWLERNKFFFYQVDSLPYWQYLKPQAY